MSLTGLNVLLAEDNPTNQMVAMQMLESLGARVTLAVDGAEALEVLDTATFDVALIDIEMPRISGIDLIRRLRTGGGPHADMPMIALTAYVMREHRAAINDVGADGIIAKPILSIEQFGDDILGIVRERSGWSPVVANQPAHVESVGGDPTIDLDVYDRLIQAFDETTRVELFEKVTADIRDASDRIAMGVDQSDFGEIRAASHVLISVSGAIGATKLQHLSQCLNSAGHAADIIAIGRDGPELRDEAGRVLEFLSGA